MKRVHVSLSEQVVREMDEAAKEEGRTRSNWVARAILEKLERERRANAERDRV